MSEITLYAFENADGDSEEFTTFELHVAHEYAQRNQLRVMALIYEYSDRGPVDGMDFTQPTEP